MKIKILISLIFSCYIHANTIAVDSTAVKNCIDNTNSEKVVFVIFDASTFFVVENTLSVNKNNVKVIENKIIPTKEVVFFQTNRIEINTVKNILVASKKLTFKNKSLPPSTTISENPSYKKNYPPLRTLPFNENFFSCNSLYCVFAISKPRFILATTLIIKKSYLSSLQKTYRTKALFLSSETPIIDSFYSKTSRIRPPPTV